MKWPLGKSPYLKHGRLSDVIAALQVMGAGERPENTIKSWAKELSYSDSDFEIDRWTTVFREHPEFFLVYALKDDPSLKSALRWRYTNKLFDSKIAKEYTSGEKAALPEPQRWNLTTRPLAIDAIATLMNTAIELHSRAIEQLTASRWWVPIFAAFLGFGGAILGAIVAALWRVDKIPWQSSLPI
jgi:hypothetical protein